MIHLENILAYVYEPQKRLKNAKKRASILHALVDFGFYGLNFGVLSSAALLVLTNDLNGGVGIEKALVNAAGYIWSLGPFAFLVIPLIGAFSSILGFSFLSAFMGLLSTLFGGNGSFKQNAFLVSRLLFPFSLVTLVIGFISQFSVVGGILLLVWAAYAFWIWITLIHIANDLPLKKSAVVAALVVSLAGLISFIFN